MTDENLVISIDGPAASGKSTIARAVASRLGYGHISSGNLYRLFALAASRASVDPSSPEAVAGALDATTPGFDPGAERYFLDDEDVTDLLASQEVSDFTSRIATQPAVRDRVNGLLRRLCEDRDTVVEGRDIGTVVFPDARLKIFLTASLEERARRRMKDFDASEDPAALDRIKSDLAERDHRDGTRTLAPLKPAEDAVTIDSTGLAIEAIVSRITEHLAPGTDRARA